MSGWIKIYRKIIESDLWLDEPLTKSQAWIDILLLANHKFKKVFIRGIEIGVPRGHLALSEVEAARRWKWSRNKVRAYLNWLEKEQQIKQQKTNVTTLISIVNYEKYQVKEQQTEQQKVQQTEQQTIQQKVQQKDTYKNSKEDKEYKNIDIEKGEIEISPTDSDLEKISSTAELLIVKNSNSEERKSSCQKKEKELVNPFPDSPEFLQAWEEWLSYRRKRKKPVSIETYQNYALPDLDQISGHNPSVAIDIIKQSLAKGWTGLFEIKQNFNNGTTNIGNTGTGTRYHTASPYPKGNW